MANLATKYPERVELRLTAEQEKLLPVLTKAYGASSYSEFFRLLVDRAAEEHYFSISEELPDAYDLMRSSVSSVSKELATC